MSKKKQEASLSSWANLPPELLETIFALLSLSDRYRFRLTCSPWRGVARLFSPPIPLPFEPPRLLLPKLDNSVCFFDVFNCKPLSCKLPCRARCLGYLSGWFFLLSDQNSSRAYLLNPVLLVEIPLPDLEFPVQKAVLSAPPGLPNCTVAVMGRSNLIALCEPAGKRWQVIDVGQNRMLRDIVFWQNQVCAIEHNSSNVLICNFDMESRRTSIVTVRFPEPYLWSIDYNSRQRRADKFGVWENAAFLVESVEGDLLAVAYCNAMFVVYKLNHDCTWNYMPLIGDQALFLGAIRSESVPVNRFLGSGLRENSIYWTSRKSRSCLGVVMVYSMEDLEASPVPVSERYSILADPIWVSPVIWP